MQRERPYSGDTFHAVVRFQLLAFRCPLRAFGSAFATTPDLMRQPAIITTFDPILWSTMVERVTVHGKNDLRFTFRNGTEITA